MVPVVEEPTSGARPGVGVEQLAGRFDRHASPRTEMPELHPGIVPDVHEILGGRTAAQTGEPSAAVSSREPIDRAAGLVGGVEDVGGNRRQHQLRTAEHLERALVVDRAPAQVDETITALSLHVRATEVDAVGGRHHADGERPLGAPRVSRARSRQLRGDTARPRARSRRRNRREERRRTCGREASNRRSVRPRRTVCPTRVPARYPRCSPFARVPGAPCRANAARPR